MKAFCQRPSPRAASCALCAFLLQALSKEATSAGSFIQPDAHMRTAGGLADDVSVVVVGFSGGERRQLLQRGQLFGTSGWAGEEDSPREMPRTDGADDDFGEVFMTCRGVESGRGAFTSGKCSEACNNPISGAEECPPKRCQCELNPDGQPAGGTLRGAGERCFNLKAHDHHAHVLLELRTAQPGLDAPLQLLGVTANRKGPRWPSMRLHDIQLFGEQTQLQLSRAQWRRDAGPRDDGEWVGMWTLCVSSPKETRTQSALVPFTLAAFLSRCPTALMGQVCSGHGSCEMQPRSCAPPLEDQLCREPRCTCEEGWSGEDCSDGADATPSPQWHSAQLAEERPAGQSESHVIRLHPPPPAPPPAPQVYLVPPTSAPHAVAPTQHHRRSTAPHSVGGVDRKERAGEPLIIPVNEAPLIELPTEAEQRRTKYSDDGQVSSTKP